MMIFLNRFTTMTFNMAFRKSRLARQKEITSGKDGKLSPQTFTSINTHVLRHQVLLST